MNYQTPNYHHCNDNAPECCVPKVRSLCSCRIAVAANVKGDCGSGQCSAPWPALMTASSRGRGHACTSWPGRGWGRGVSRDQGPHVLSVEVWGCDEVMRWGPQPGTKVRPWVSAAGCCSGDPNPALLPATVATGHPIPCRSWTRSLWLIISEKTGSRGRAQEKSEKVLTYKLKNFWYL